mgnify:CR=1 FL=1
MFILFVTLVGPIVFFMLTWVVATVYRLYFPEHPLPFEHDPVMVRQRAIAAGKSVPVGVREIQADERHRRRRAARERSYHYAWGGSDGLPEQWEEDLWRRRN